MTGKRSTATLLSSMLLVLSAPVAAESIDLSQLCGSGDCVVSTNKSIVSASGPLTVPGNFTLNPGVVLEFLVPITININGNMVLGGTLGAPGNGGSGGAGGNSLQPGGAGGAAPAVVSGVFNAQGSITLNAGSTAVADGGSGGDGGFPGFGSNVGGDGGAGGAAGSLTFNACSTFNSASGAQIRVNGGPGGVGQAAALGGIGGAGGTVIINSKQTIVSDASVSALGGAGGAAGAGAAGPGSNGSDGFITLSALGTITVGAGTLNAGANTPSINASQATNPAFAFCPVPQAANIPTLSEWAMMVLVSLIVLFSIHRLRARSGSRPKSVF